MIAAPPPVPRVRVCVCVCVARGISPLHQYLRRLWGLCFPREHCCTCILIHFAPRASEAAAICIPRHAADPPRLTGAVLLFFFLFVSFFFFEELLYTSEASDGWLLHRPGVNLSCVKLSVLKEAVCAAVVVADSRCGVTAAERSVASWICVVTCPSRPKDEPPNSTYMPPNLHILILMIY